MYNLTLNWFLTKGMTAHLWTREHASLIPWHLMNMIWHLLHTLTLTYPQTTDMKACAASSFTVSRTEAEGFEIWNCTCGMLCHYDMYLRNRGSINSGNKESKFKHCLQVEVMGIKMQWLLLCKDINILLIHRFQGTACFLRSSWIGFDFYTFRICTILNLFWYVHYVFTDFAVNNGGVFCNLFFSSWNTGWTLWLVVSFLMPFFN